MNTDPLNVAPPNDPETDDAPPSPPPGGTQDGIVCYGPGLGGGGTGPGYGIAWFTG